MKKHSIRKRALSVILAGLLCVSILIPSSVLAGSSVYENAWTITVLDAETGAAVAGAAVDYQICVNDVSDESGSADTAEDGSVAVDAVANLSEDAISAGTVRVDYAVTAEGYEEMTGSCSVASATENHDVYLTASAVQTEEYTVTVQSGTGGTVTLDGETVDSKTVASGTEVSVAAAPESGYYLKTLVISNDPVEFEKTGYTGTVTVSENMTITAEFQKFYTVSMDNYDTDAGTVRIDGSVMESGASLEMDDGTAITLSVEAKEGYCISAVSVGGKEQDISADGVSTFTLENYTVKADTEIAVSFSELYVMTVTYSEDGGIVVTEPDGDIASGVAVKEGNSFTVTATPEEHYRVAKVVKDGQTEEYSENDYSYTDTIENISGEHTYEITFALNRYTVNFSAGENGSLSAASELVEYGAAPTVTITPDEGYTVDSVQISQISDSDSGDVDPDASGAEASAGNDEQADSSSDEYVLAEGSATDYVITAGITSETAISVTFKEMDSVEYDSAVSLSDSDSLRTDADSNTYIFAKGASVVFTASDDYDGIRISGTEEGDTASSLKYYNTSGNSVTVTDTITVTGIQVLSGKEWKDVELSDGGLRIVFDETEPTGTLTPEDPNENEYYNSNVTIDVSVNDPDEYSGIASVEYAVSADGNEPDSADRISIYSFDGSSGDGASESSSEPGAQEQLRQSWTGQITVDAETYNTANVTVFLYVTDRAGNSYSTSTTLKVNSTAPTVSVSMVENGENSDEAEPGYYSVARMAEITIVDREDTFDETAADISISATDAAGGSVKDPAVISEWTTDEEDSSVHTATVSFNADANYEWSISYKNKAGLSCAACDDSDEKINVDSETGDDIYIFTVDCTAPEVDSNAKIGVEDALWKGIPDSTSAADTVFALWEKDAVTISLDDQDISDATSPIKTVLYYETASTTSLTREELCSLYAEGEFTEEEYVTAAADAYVTVYARITDYAGNTVYVGTDGVVVDMSQSGLTLTPEEPLVDNGNESVYGYYTDDVTIDVEATDQIENAASYSGIASVDYVITCDGSETESGNLYPFTTETMENPTQAELQADWSGIITVNAEANNSDNVAVIVTVTDNAGNVQTETIYLQINVTKPTVDVVFDDENSPVYQVATDDGGTETGYFAQSRTATITITERTSVFDEAAATDGISIEAVDAKGNGVSLDVSGMIGEWTTQEGDSPDAATHTAEVRFDADGVYTWSVSYTDKTGYAVETADETTGGTADDTSGQSDDGAAENEIGTVEYSGETPLHFAVDTTEPTASITVNENKWTQFLSKLTFGLFSNVKADVSAEYDDVTSPYDVDYYKTSDALLYTEAELNDLFENGGFSTYSDFTVTGDEQFVVYLRVTDYAGNYTYVNSDGYIVDTTASDITLTPSEPAADNGDEDVYGYYNDDVTVDIDVSEADTDYSGIQLIEYWITDGTEAEDDSVDKTTLYEYDYTRDAGENNNGGTLTVTETDCDTGETEETTYSGEVPAQEQLKQEWTGQITVDAETYNTSDVTVFVHTVDNAGNEKTESVKLDIDITAPTIEITYDNNTARNSRYFNAARTATIVITERTNHFEASAATGSITITAKDSSGQKVSVGDIISSWTTEEGSTPDEAMHWATISYTADANYTFAVDFADKATNRNTTPDTADSVAPYTFTVDKTAPAGTVTAVSKEGRTSTWSRLLSSLTFGFYSNVSISLTSTQADATSPIESVKYYKTSSSTAMTQSQLKSLTGWSSFSGLTVKANEQFVVYLQITDYAGNVTYISTDGLIVDDTAPIEESIAPEITVSPEQPVNGYYNGNVNVSIKVTDPKAGNTYSGLKEVRYEVLNMGEVTQSGTLYSFTDSSPSISSLRQTWSGSITVDANLNNSNDVQIVVYAADNAGNTSQDSAAIQIDVTAPVIDISYNNNSPDSSSYYNSERVATIVVTERNFDGNNVVVNITNTDGTIPAISGWTTAQGSGNGDGTTHTATITYSADGDYTFDISYTDQADNACASVNFAAGTANATEFTIDMTNPTISVSYDNNSVSGERYFAETRTATITVNEHNFDVSRVVFTQTASLDGSSITVPNASWSNNGDIHTATITYSADGDYTFDVTMTDMAGNESGEAGYGSSVAARDFTIDLSIEKPVITGVENGVSYRGEVIPGVNFSDVNYDSYEITLLRTRKDVIDEDVTDTFITAVSTNGYGGEAEFDTFEEIQDNDGIYTMTVTMRDKAGNEETETVVFTVNRFGSVYAFNQALIDLEDAYVQKVDDELVITEYNPDRLVEGSLSIEVTKDGSPLSDVEYEVSPVINEYAAVGSSGWYQYAYTIDTSNFDSDGIYRITVSSEDEAGNLPETTNYDECEVLFRVDTTVPEITAVSGLEEAIVNAESVDVDFDIYDSIGLASVTAYMDGSEYQTWTGEEIEGQNTYEGAFTIEAANSTQSVRIVVKDLAGNVLDTDEQNADGDYIFDPGFDFNRDITVSTNFFVRWRANKAAFCGTIIAVIVIAALIVFGVVYRRRKKDDSREKEAAAQG
ncbi:MAG: hypothetical protein LUF32_05415 [Clostridiales bacterium]|nr:hypothetical protein [Clostridiales bacterium]